MIGIPKSAAIGACGFALAWLVLFPVAVVFGIADEHWGAPASHIWRQSLALITVAVVIGTWSLVLGVVPVALARSLRANPWWAVAVAGLLGGVTIHWLLRSLSIWNDCVSGVALPYTWIEYCSHSA